MEQDESRKQTQNEVGFSAALRELSEKDIIKLVNFARLVLSGVARCGYVDVEDLFMDAIVRTMERSRTWKQGVSIASHLLAVMRSIGHQRFKQAIRHTPLNEDVLAYPAGSYVSVLDARSSIYRLREALRGDSMALSVLGSLSDEIRPRNAHRALGVNAAVYWAARKRIQRAAERLRGSSGPVNHTSHR